MNLKTGDTIIVGMDGGIESTVAAYLLKKQGYNCVGITVVFHEEDVEDHGELLSAWLPDDLEHVKEICKVLEIPFYATNASDLYFDKVVDKVVSARLSGKSYEPMVDRTTVILDTLLSKREQLGASVVATGHYCKVLKNQTTGMLNLYRANDLEEDDSYYVSKLDTHLLGFLHFPLAELREQEVLKVASLIPTKFNLEKKERREKRLAFMQEEDLSQIVEKYSAPTLRKEGIVLNYFDSGTVGDHLGIHQFYLGQVKIPLKGKIPRDKDSEVLRIIPSTGTIYLEKTEKIKFDRAYLIDFNAEDNLNRSLPLSCYAMLGPRKEVLKCTIQFKNNGSVLIIFDKEVQGHLGRGQYVVLFNKKGIGARVIGGGQVRISGFLDNGEFRTLPKNKDEEEELETEEKMKKKDLGF
ncbi:tRNA methyltransferase [Bacteriovorax sp. DB6_IX]|uniref:tRNA methyltransferase n=1 Tax=Bacteriovorax sp. DB6_IX TaxID=1353530 RepID=UPI00038A3FB7|nr:tRNA methyltransferase [Bacteriovorax sp. DB6_IX]EQC52287.1 tRNA methyl transferase [Bacteriovorax sp. DB6_IX]